MNKIEEIVANIKKDLPGKSLDEMNKYMFKNVLSKLKEMDIHYGRSKEDKKTYIIEIASNTTPETQLKVEIPLESE